LKFCNSLLPKVLFESLKQLVLVQLVWNSAMASVSSRHRGFRSTCLLLSDMILCRLRLLQKAWIWIGQQEDAQMEKEPDHKRSPSTDCLGLA
jgi:hypothetical protein